MKRTSKVKESQAKELPPFRKASTPEAREQQMISLAVDLAETQLRNGTASSQVICHYLKLGSMEKQLEMERLKKENKLLEAKTEDIERSKRIEEMYSEALEAMKRYSGRYEDDETVI